MALVKRSKTVGHNLNQVSPSSRNNGLSSTSANLATSSNSVIAARKDVQSTAELVAQLTGNLPQNMTIDLNRLDTEFRKSSVCDNKNSAPTVTFSVVICFCLLLIYFLFNVLFLGGFL